MWHGFYDHTRHDLQIAGAADANGLVVAALGPVPLGFCWYLERWTAWSNSAGNTLTMELYVTADGKAPASPDKTGRQDETGSPKNAVGDLASPIYIGPGNFLVASWAGFTQADAVRLSTQIRVHKLQAHFVRKQQPQQVQPQPPSAEGDAGS